MTSERPPAGFQRDPAPTLAETLAGLPVRGNARLGEVRLTAVVAATLRAALDLALGEAEAGAGLEASWDDGALDVTWPAAAHQRIEQAAALLETVGGSLGPAGGSHWTLRVPVSGSREIYLMLEQGPLALALPWHAVVRMRMATAASIEALSRREGWPILPPLAVVSGTPEERPAVAIAHGLRRALLVADRLVWRMPASLAEDGVTPPSPAAHLGPAVRTDDGEIYWAVDPARLLKGVKPLPIPPVTTTGPGTFGPAAGPPPSRPPAAPIGGAARRRAERPAPEPARADEALEGTAGQLEGDLVTAVPPDRAGRGRPKLTVLTRAHVEPLPAPPDGSAAAPGSGASASPTGSAMAARRVLLAEDSVIGRIFLERLLERAGFHVESVGSARQLDERLRQGSWTAVFADVELPDSPRGAHLARAGSAPAGQAWIALVRDAEDERLARGAGLAHTLRKPFEQPDVEDLLRRLGGERADR